MIFNGRRSARRELFPGSDKVLCGNCSAPRTSPKRFRPSRAPRSRRQFPPTRRGDPPARSPSAPETPALLLVLVVMIFDGAGKVMRRMTLVVPELSIDAIGRQQFLVRAALDRLATGDD